jgi:hypothetical protein
MMAVLALSACRDEQAGPKGRAAPTGQAGSPRTVEGEPGYTFRSGATWASGAVTYLGSVVEPAQPRPGDQVTLRHYFRSTDRAPRGYRFFIHVVDPATSPQLGNLDHELQGGSAPLGTWPPGKLIEDVHAFQMPAYPGTLQLRLGFWDERGRLPVDAPLQSDGNNRLLGPAFAPPAEQPLPEYQVPRAPRPPTIDGRLDDEVWKAAPAVTLGSSMDGSPTVRKTVLRMLYDDAHLYVAFDAEDPDVWGTYRKKDDPIYNEDACEVFIDADGDGATYNELQVSPHNVNFDASFVTRRSDLAVAMKWESGMETAVQVKGTIDDDSDTDERWTAEMKIPLANLNHVPRLPPRPGDVWRFNAYRLEHLQRRTRVEGQSFSPLHVGDFHYLPRFGKLVFR